MSTWEKGWLLSPDSIALGPGILAVHPIPHPFTCSKRFTYGYVKCLSAHQEISFFSLFWPIHSTSMQMDTLCSEPYFEQSGKVRLPTEKQWANYPQCLWFSCSAEVAYLNECNIFSRKRFWVTVIIMLCLVCTNSNRLAVARIWSNGSLHCTEARLAFQDQHLIEAAYFLLDLENLISKGSW